MVHSGGETASTCPCLVLALSQLARPRKTPLMYPFISRRSLRAGPIFQPSLLRVGVPASTCRRRLLKRICCCCAGSAAVDVWWWRASIAADDTAMVARAHEPCVIQRVEVVVSRNVEDAWCWKLGFWPLVPLWYSSYCGIYRGRATLSASYLSHKVAW